MSTAAKASYLTLYPVNDLNYSSTRQVITVLLSVSQQKTVKVPHDMLRLHAKERLVVCLKSAWPFRVMTGSHIRPLLLEERDLAKRSSND